MGTYDTDVLIIGAGPSGTSSAALLHRAGFKVQVVEKEKFPRFIIGESLLPRCMDLLEEAGMLDAVKEQGYIEKTGAVFFRGQEAAPFDFSQQFTPGWDYTYQVPRGPFDKTLADCAQEQGVPILWEHTVDRIDFTDDGPVAGITGPGGKKVRTAARFVLDASGFGRVLPRLLDLDMPSALPRRDSLFTHVTGDRRPGGREEGRIWICLLPENAWIWIIPFSDGKTSVGVVGEPGFLDRFPGSQDEQLRAILHSEENARERLADAEFVFPAKRINGYSIGVKQLFGRGYALLGNATEFLDPVFSSGVTLALESANRASKTLIRQLNGESVDWQEAYADYLLHGVETFRTYVNAWYDGRLLSIFFSPQKDEAIQKQICSVLAGYVWDMDNPYVKKHARAVSSLAKMCAART